MQSTVDGFSYGWVTLVAGFVMACLGAALGLRCTVRSLRHGSRKAGWLALGAVTIGCGIWSMHFIAMLGFKVHGASISYDVPLTFLSLAVAVLVVGAGVFTVGYRGTAPRVLLTSGVLTGLGIGAMHYLGMAAMRMDGRLLYDPLVVTLSLLIAVVAATAALWAAVSIRGFLPTLGASVVMGIAVTGMHYTGMAAVSAEVSGSHSAHSTGGTSALEVVPMLLVGPLAFLLLAAVVVMFDPMLILGDDEPRRPEHGRPRAQHRAALPYGAEYPRTAPVQAQQPVPADFSGSPADPR
ncbi:MHYT domain-containing protein [Streptomyces sp. NPDC004111]|uniref:MHYT domain-containing protein n=1 Tax=Streptomyces sp. NPDC004111 TaxID=3364690 RepID=UPI0036CF0481